MRTVNVVVDSEVSSSTRVKQVSGMFDVPAQQKVTQKWNFEFPYDEEPWTIGLIVGPSGSGKSTIARHEFGKELKFEWRERSLIDDFDKSLKVAEISGALSSVGLNTIPSWLKPFGVLSNGEQFRASIARTLLESDTTKPTLIDEFTSVVDRQVAKVASHSVQKYVRQSKKQLVAVSCHYDIADWLQPDWVLDMATCSFKRRLLQRRPKLEVAIGQVAYDAWRLFAPFHYMSSDLNKAAKCFGVWVNGVLASFTGVLHFPHPKLKNLKRESRSVTLPDYQGLGLTMVLADALGSAYKALGMRYRRYPAHPKLIASIDRQRDKWLRVKEGGVYSQATNFASLGGRPCATYEYIGPPMEVIQARSLLA